MYALFYENRLGIKKSMIRFVYLCCPKTGTKFRELYHSNHVIPHRASGAPRKPRRLIRLKYFAGMRKRVSPIVNTGDTQGIIPISLSILLQLRQYLIEPRHEKKVRECLISLC